MDSILDPNRLLLIIVHLSSFFFNQDLRYQLPELELVNNSSDYQLMHSFYTNESHRVGKKLLPKILFLIILNTRDYYQFLQLFNSIYDDYHYYYIYFDQVKSLLF